MVVICESEGVSSEQRFYSIEQGQEIRHLERRKDKNNNDSKGWNPAFKFKVEFKLSCLRLFSKFIFLLRRVFLPKGYPDSVSPDYVEYQLWDTLQDSAHAIFTAWTIEATFRAVGVGNENATTMAATTTVLLKDLTAKLGSLTLLHFKSEALHQDNKKWRLFADALNDVNIFFRLLIPLFPIHWIPLLFCLAQMVQVVVEGSSEASRTVVAGHLAKDAHNMVEVRSKEKIQSCATKICAMACSIFLLRLLSAELSTVMAIYCIYVTIHLYGNYRLVKTLRMDTLNEGRFLICLQHYFHNQSLPSIRAVNEAESVFLGSGLSDVDVCGYKISLGVSIHEAFPFSTIQNSKKDFHDYTGLVKGLKSQSFVIIPNWEEVKVSVILRQGITPVQIIESYFRAAVVGFTSLSSSSPNPANYSWDEFKGCLHDKNFKTDVCLLKVSNWRLDLVDLP